MWEFCQKRGEGVFLNPTSFDFWHDNFLSRFLLHVSTLSSCSLWFHTRFFCFSISHSFLLVLYFIQQLLFVDLLPTISHTFLLLSSYHYFYHLLFTFLFPCSMDFHLQGKENESSKDHFCRNWIPFCFSDFTFQRRVLFLHQIQTQVFILPFCHSANNFLQFNW